LYFYTKAVDVETDGSGRPAFRQVQVTWGCNEQNSVLETDEIVPTGRASVWFPK
jgi:hypothetical protein